MKTFAIYSVCLMLAFNIINAEISLNDIENDISKLEGYIHRAKAVGLADNSVETDQQKADAKFLDELNALKAIESKEYSKKEIKGGDLNSDDDIEAQLIAAIKKGNALTDDVTFHDSADSSSNLFESDDVPIDILSDKDKCKDYDTSGRCAQYVKEGRCATSEEKMVERCAKSCGFCCFDIAKTEICQILKEKQKACDNPSQLVKMKTYCFKTCDHCFRRAPAVPPCTVSKFGCCWDRSTTALAKIGTAGDGCPRCANSNSDLFCNRFHTHCNAGYKYGYDIWRNCPVTCGACKAEQCEDHPDEMKRCKSYKELGFCEAKRKNMAFYCKKTCGLCGCVDRSLACKQVENAESCKSYNVIVKHMCPATCGLC